MKIEFKVTTSTYAIIPSGLETHVLDAMRNGLIKDSYDLDELVSILGESLNVNPTCDETQMSVIDNNGCPTICVTDDNHNDIWNNV